MAARQEARRRAAGTISVTTKDDPTLPRGVTNYIGTLANKHRGDYQSADKEFQEQLPGLLQAHPTLDIRKARQSFDALFSKGATADDDAGSVYQDAPAAPTPAPAAEGRKTRSPMSAAPTIEPHTGASSLGGAPL